jgi:N-acetylmuramoyl-L-alanine amidase
MKKSIIYLFFAFLLLGFFGCSKRTQEYGYDPYFSPYSPPAPPPKTIMLDAGHGGTDNGSDQFDVHEKDLTLKTTYYAKEHLEKLGYRVVLTRTNDTFVSKDQRVALANKINPDALVSIHFNSAPSKKAEGIEVYYHESEQNPERTKKSKRLAKKILDRAVSTTKAESRGIKTANFRVIKKTTMPAALIECGFLSNAEERARAMNPAYQDALGKGIARGVHDYFRDPLLD